MNDIDKIGKAQAAIALKVPRSGVPELDDMIRESRRLDMATAAMQGLIASSGDNDINPELCASFSVRCADALLAASEKEQMK